MEWGGEACRGSGKDECRPILEDGVVESFETLEIEEEERIFQQDNDPKHTSKRHNSGLKITIFKY